MKEYLVEFTYLDGTKEEVTFKTDKLEWSVTQYYRNRMIKSHEVIKEGRANTKQILLG
jgi:antitoxin component YwqK of YwqJK toxin-antitoxin module